MLGFAALILAQATSPGGPVYLKCSTEQNGATKFWDITLNEANGTVDYRTDISGQQRRPARFTSDAVYFIGFTLSRVDLTLQRENFFGGRSLGFERGACQLAENKARAF